MDEKLGRVSRSKLEEICAVLRNVRGASHIDLRVYHRSLHSNQQSQPGGERISIPVDILPDVLQMLDEAREELSRRGLLNPTSQMTTMEDGQSVHIRLLPPGRRGDSRREPRLSLAVPVGCRLVEDAESKTATGQTEDVSYGGTKVWLTERFSLFSKVELFMRIGEVNVQGRAQVVAAEVHSKDGRYRHSLQWVGINPEAKSALLKLTKSLADSARSTDSSSG